MRTLVKTIKKLDLSIGIGEATRITGASSAQLRYWEKKGLVQTIQHQDGGNKRYDFNALMRIILIKHYIDNGYTLAKTSEVIESRCTKGATVSTFIRQRLLDIENNDPVIKLHFGKIDNDPENQLVVEIEGENVKLLTEPIQK